MQSAEPLRPRDLARRVKAPDRPRQWGDLRFSPQQPVRWFSPGVLTGAGLRVLVSAAFGSYLDKRELQGTLAGDSFSHRPDDEEIWLDFVADTGDGFAPTYTIAWLTAQERLRVDGLAEPLPRASLLVCGGDEVYPHGTPDAYEDRFVGPFRAALPWVEHDPPELLALAGNHDWYDGLSSFVRLFCQGRWIGARRTRQTRSYFAVLLPHRWWLWGIDIQFDTYLDDPQIKYFERVLTQEMRAGDRLILCTGKPSWTELREDPDAFRNLAFVERLIRSRGVNLMLTLTGDSHHYARYEGPGGAQKVTAGGGGAFLHPTHDLVEQITVDVDSDDVPPATYTRKACYPPRGRSRLMALGAVLLPLRNPSFMALPAVVYVLLAWAGQFGIRALDQVQSLPLDMAAPTYGFRDLALGLLRNPNSVVLALVFLIGLISFAKPPPRFAFGRSGLVAKSIMGTVHGAMHLVASILVIMAAIRLAGLFADAGWYTLWLFVFVGLLGGVAGGLVMGVYLTSSNLVPRWEAHGNEAFSAMRITGFKNFVRVHIDRDGLLRLYPIGLDKVVQRWRLDPDNPHDGAPWLAPAGGPPKPFLLEGPIVIDGRHPEAGST
jgi:hypothetical protein